MIYSEIETIKHFLIKANDNGNGKVTLTGRLRNSKVGNGKVTVTVTVKFTGRSR